MPFYINNVLIISWERACHFYYITLLGVFAPLLAPFNDRMKSKY